MHRHVHIHVYGCVHEHVHKHVYGRVHANVAFEVCADTCIDVDEGVNESRCNDYYVITDVQCLICDN